MGEPGRATKQERNEPPSSAYATPHRKIMRNYTYGKGTEISNLFGEDLGAPNAEAADQKATNKTALRTISVDIGTVVGGWVFVFHKTAVKGKKVASGDHTGWIKVKQLPKPARDDIKAEQKKVDKADAKGKGSGHDAPVKPGEHAFAVTNAAMLTNKKAADHYNFRIKGGGGSTPLANYTHEPANYGDVIVGVWNPPGSGADGKRFAGSGGVRTFLPLDQKFALCDVGAMTVEDAAGKATSLWRYIRAEVKGDEVFCWVLQSWTTPTGTGANF